MNQELITLNVAIGCSKPFGPILGVSPIPLLTCGQDCLNGLLQLVEWKKIKKFTCYFTFCWEKANGEIFLESRAVIIISTYNYFSFGTILQFTNAIWL